MSDKGLPCKQCIAFAICRNKAILLEKGKLRISRLSIRCPIMRDYCYRYHSKDLMPEGYDTFYIPIRSKLYMNILALFAGKDIDEALKLIPKLSVPYGYSVR
jgi:hypothetical protein